MNRQAIIRLPEVKSRTGLSRSTIYQRMSNGSFPASISIGVRSIGWVEKEIDNWIENQIQQSRDSV